MEVTAAIPMIHTTFLYFADGREQRRFRAVCIALPREGELVRPERGGKRVIVHAVAYCIEQLEAAGFDRMMLPIVFLRDLTPDEEQRYLGLPADESGDGQ